jgi:hypothetical protein
MILHRQTPRRCDSVRLDAYIKTPTEQNWRTVQSTARILVQKINVAVEAAMNFDAQFYDEGQRIIVISNGTLQTVDRSYNQPFTIVREQWDGRANVLQQVVELQNRPTPEQATVWENELKERYKLLNLEMMRLLDMVKQRT